MQNDPMTYVLAALMLGGAIGFFACALFASKRIREERRSWWREGYGACNRDHHRNRL
jgi:gas vesicle protein